MTEKKKTKHAGAKRTIPVDRVGEETIDVQQPAQEGAAASVQESASAVADELAAALAQRDEYLDHLRRLQAEFDNYRKRVRREAEELRLQAAEAVMESLLPVLDNMARALNAAASCEDEQLLDGLNLVAGQFKAALQGSGLEEVAVEAGTPFDPTFHEAITTQTSDEYEEDAVLQVLERGYLLNGRLLRPAKVIVVSGDG